MRTEAAQALSKRPADVGRALLAVPESQWFDRKSARTAPRDLANAEIAFANAEGGTIVVGLSRQGVEGVDTAKANDLRQAAMDFAAPPVRAHASEIECVNENGAAARLLVIEVEPSDAVHSNPRDEVYLRVGDETRRLSFAQRQELVYDKGQSVFDGSPAPDASEDDLKWESIRGWAESLGAADPKRLLRRRGLLRREGLTAASVLLFGVNPQIAFPNAYVRVLRHRGAERQTGERQQLGEDQSFDGAIDEILSRSAEAVRTLQPTVRRLSAYGRFADVPLIPERAWVEAIVNAVIHRSYSLGGDHIRVEIFDNRIEVSNPGRFPGLFEERDPREVMRFARNPRIARVCAELGWAQELGEGIRRMFDEMAAAGLPAPSYRQTAGAVQVVLMAVPVDEETAEALPAGWQDVVAALHQAGGLKTGEVEELLGVSRPTAIKRLRLMQELGVIRRHGQSDTDPVAFWALADHTR